MVDAWMAETSNEVAMTISPEALEIFWSHDWDTLYPRLAVYAKRELQKRGWSIERFPPQDIVNLAIERVLNAQRNWTAEEVNDKLLLGYLCDVIDSIIGHLPREWKKILKLREMGDLTEAEAAAVERRVGTEPDPGEAQLRQELEAESDHAFWAFYNSLDDEKDKDLKRILECFYEGITKRDDIAKKLNIPLKDFDNARRRLKDRVKKAFPQAVAARMKRR